MGEGKVSAIAGAIAALQELSLVDRSCPLLRWRRREGAKIEIVPLGFNH
jgi:hypothetical protein